MNKLGLYITNLMEAIRDTEEKGFTKNLIRTIKRLNQDISTFIFDWIDEIESLSSKCA